MTGMVLLDQTIQTDYGQFTLEWGDDCWDGDADRFFMGQENGWVAAAIPDVVHVVMARRSGGSSVRIESFNEEPPLDPSWEDCVEVSFTVPEGVAVRWVTFAGEDGGKLHIAAGGYRLRVSARGRDKGHEGEFDPDVVDYYLLQLWPSSIEPDAVLRVGSADAAYWNAEWGNRRDGRIKD
jgi:hypothetical protein